MVQGVSERRNTLVSSKILLFDFLIQNNELPCDKMPINYANENAAI
jgi:hypothetical protein